MFKHDLARVVLFFVILVPRFASANLVSERLSFPSSPSSSASKINKSFEKLKILENKKQWAECADLAKTQFEAQKQVRSWVLLTWLHCARSHDEQKKRNEKLIAPLSACEEGKDFLVQSPVQGVLFSEMVKSRLLLVELQLEQLKEKKNQQAVWNNLDLLLSYGERLDKEIKAKIYFYFSELSQRQHNLKAAKQFLTQSLAEKDTRQSREKLNSVLLALGEQDLSLEKKGFQMAVSMSEQKAEDRLEVLSTDKNHIGYLEEAVQYLNRYPNGRSSRSVQERVLEIYSSLTEKVLANSSDQEKYLILRQRALEVMEKIDPLRATEWAKSLHRRNDFEASLKLAERGLSSLMFSPHSATLLYIAGRSTQFLGRYHSAQKYFEQYIEHNSGAEDVPEVMFRLGLIHLRLKQFPAAATVFERVLQLPGSDRYELSSRYWLIRALQRQGNARATAEAQAVIEKYPFSYYGIRLQAEQNGNQFEFLEKLKQNSQISESFFQSPLQAEALKRARYLADHGWRTAAQREIASLTIPSAPILKSLLAQKFAQAKVFPLAIRLVNEAGDKNPDLRAADLIAISYPNEFQSEIEKEAKRALLSPVLIKSLIRQESAFGIEAKSYSNALGLMQLIPPTAQEVAQELKLGNIDIPEDVYQPEINIQMGTYYIAKMIKQHGGSVPMGLAAYNAGPQRMKSFLYSRSEVSDQLTQHSSDPDQEIWFDELPWSETSFYVKAILRNSILYKTFEQKKVSLEGVIWKDLTKGLVEPGKF